MNPFTAHPHTAGQGYWQHCGFALRVAGRALLIALIAVLHALLPFWFQTGASDRLLKLADEIRAARTKH